VAGPVTIPGGQLLMIDYSSTPLRLCCETPGILSRHLAAAGVRDARINLPPGTRCCHGLNWSGCAGCRRARSGWRPAGSS
jgi:hypothetical protein